MVHYIFKNGCLAAVNSQFVTLFIAYIYLKYIILFNFKDNECNDIFI